MRQLLAISSVAEGLTGMSLLLVPQLFFWLIFGVELPESAAFLCRIAGVALFCLAIACWPHLAYLPALGRQRVAMLVYNVLAAVLLAAAGATATAGLLLWPAAAYHAAMGALLAIRRPVGSIDLL